MSSPQISIILPAWNAEKYLAESIDSLLAQTFTNFELIVINDRSTDTTEQIVRSYETKDSRVKLVQNELEKGVAGALNTGLLNAQGKYIARHDGDDLARPDKLRKQYEFLESHPEIHLLGTGYAPFNTQGTRLEILHPSSSIELAWRFMFNSFFCHPSVMFRKSLYEEFGGYPIVKSEDFAYFSKIIKKYQTANLPEVLLDYREHDNNVSKVNGQELGESAFLVSQENVKYYLGNLDNYDLLKRFQQEKTARISELVKIKLLNWKILNKIRQDYGLSFFSPQVWAFHLKLWSWYWLIILRKLKSKFF